MRHSAMRGWALSGLLVISGAIGCATSPEASSTEGAPDCTSPTAQKLLTYCASPQAAALAKQNAAIQSAVGKGESAAAFVPVPVGQAPVKGAAEAPVTVVMYTDLQCPFCARAHETLTAMMEAAPDDIRLVFKHAPLPFHEDAVPAALGALAAGEQGKFWEYADLAYDHQEALGAEQLAAYAEQLGLDMAKWRRDFGSDAHVAQIEADMAEARRLGVEGTPTMFFNGVRVAGAYPREALQQVVDAQKTLVDALLQAEVPQDDLYWRLVTLQYDSSDMPGDDTAAEAAPQPEPSPAAVLVPVGDAPVKGASAEDAVVTIVEFSDFECPFCARATTSMEEVLASRLDKVRLAYRHFPLPFHQNAGPAAVASMIAAEHGKFWPYHDLLFAHQDALNTDDLVAYAEQVGLDPDAFRARLADAALTERIAADVELGHELGVEGTPTFFINGVLVVGALSPDEFASILDEQIAVGERLKDETGAAGDALYEAIVEANQETVE